MNTRRLLHGTIGLALALLFGLLPGIPFCSAEGTQAVDGYFDNGDSPPPGSIVAREWDAVNHTGMVNEYGTIDDTVGGTGARYNIPYSQWKTEDGSTGKGAWVPNLSSGERIEVARTHRQLLSQSQGYELYPNNRGPVYYNCIGPAVKAYEARNLSLPVADHSTLTPAGLFNGLTGVQMQGLQTFDATYGAQYVDYQFHFLTESGWDITVEVKTLTSDGRKLENIINTYFRGGPHGPGGSGGGGVESRPLWLGRTGTVKSASVASSSRIAVGASELLAQLLPTSGPRGEVGTAVEPRDVLGGSNAVAAVGMDYRTTGGDVSASIFGAETADSIYEHDYPVCSRVRLGELDSILPVMFGEHWWWAIDAHNDHEPLDEVVVPVSIILNGTEAVVDSRYIVENYPSGITGTVLNYQIRAKELCDAFYFLDSILDELAETYTVTYANTAEPTFPMVFAHTAEYVNGSIRLDMENWGASQTVNFTGPVWPEPRGGAETTVEFDITVPNGRSIVNLPVGQIHDAVIYIEAGGFTDKVYVAGGYWFAWDDKASGGTSSVAMVTAGLEHAPLPGNAPWFVCPPQAEMTGSVTDVLSWGHVGMGYSFRQAAQPIDISGADSVAFWVKGDGKDYRVKLESASVADNDFHGHTFTAPTDWQVVRIPFSQFAQEGWGTPVAWTGTDIRTISFVTVGRPHESIHLFVDRISFLQSGVRADLIDPIKRTPNGVDAATFGATVTGVFGDDFYIETADRSSGICVNSPGHTLEEGDKVDVGGIVRTYESGERYVEASSVKKVGTGTIKPLGLGIRALGGRDYHCDIEPYAGQQGVTDDPYGLNTTGLLIRTWGAVTLVDGSTFMLDDGSGPLLKCVVPAGVTIGPTWGGVQVTGISSCYVDGTETKRLLKVRRQEDILPLW